jgi:hypothetical protein
MKGTIRRDIVAPLVVLAVASLVTTLIPSGWTRLLSEASRALVFARKWLVSPVTIPMWLAAVLSIVALSTLVFLFIIVAARRTKPVPEHLKYTRDTLLGIKWRWQYGPNGIANVRAFCPNCDLEVHSMNPSSYRAVAILLYHCEECGWSSETFPTDQMGLIDRVCRMIEKEIRLKESGPAKS